MNGTRKFVDTRHYLLTALYAFVALALVAGQDPPVNELLGRLVTLVILWLLVTFALGAAANFLLNRWLARRELRPKTATGSRAESGRTTGEALYLKYLRLRAYVLWAYQSDPYEEDYDAGVEENYRPVEVLLPRHVVERLQAWAERNQVSLSDAVEQMAVAGLADDHLTAIVTRPGWEELLDEEGWAP